MNETHDSIDGLGERLYTLREAHKLSQDELAEILNVSRQTISNWENDKVKLDVVKASEVCKLYGISTDELLSGKKPTEAQPQKTPKRTRLILPIAVLCLSAISIVVSLILICTKQSSEISSTINFTEKAGFIVVAVCGAIALIVSLYFILKEVRK